MGSRRNLVAVAVCSWLLSLQACEDDPQDGTGGGGGTGSSTASTSSSGSTASNASTASSSGTSSSSSVASTTSQGGGGEGGMGGGGGGGNCTPDKLCLEVVPIQGQAASGEIAVLWFQLDDDGPDPAPLVAYQAPFD